MPGDGFNEGAYIITYPDPFGYLAADQFHLTDLGAQVLAEAVVRELYYRGF